MVYANKLLLDNMDNYQLYRSNVALGGQLKWNISVDNGSNGLFVSDFHIVPVSERVPFNRYAQDNLLNYSHLENIKSFYHKVESSFYQSYPNPLISSDQPLITNWKSRKDYFDLHDDTFDMGAYRARYSIYGKEIGIFCPVWLEDVSTKSISFTFYVKGQDQTTGVVDTLCVKTLTLDPQISGGEYHDKFVNYLYQYIDDIQLDDRIIKADLDSTSAIITGVDVSIGKVKTINADKMMQDLVCKERLLMDADSLIIDQFANHQMIAKQLFNFNFLFNSEDFFPPTIMKMIDGASVYFDVVVSVGGNQLDIKDFYTNYEFIPSKYLGSLDSIGLETTNMTINIFDELRDNKNLELIDKNKVQQSICHWSIIGDNDYIFNVYPEFGGFYTQRNGSSEEVARANQLYQDTPNIWLERYYRGSNTNGWVSIYNISSFREYLDLPSRVVELDEAATKPDKWVNHINYDITDSELNNIYEDIQKVIIIKMRAASVPNDSTLIEWSKILREFKKKFQPDTNGVIEATDPTCDEKYWYIVADPSDETHVIMARWNKVAKLLMLITCEMDSGTMNGSSFAGFYNLLNCGYVLQRTNDQYGDTYIQIKSGNSNRMLDALTKIKLWMSKVVQPSIVSFDKGLKFTMAAGPSKNIRELEHYDVRLNKRITRMGGYIRPTFVSPDKNYIYTKVIFDSDDDFKGSVFPVYKTSGYLPKYPSIYYYPWNKHSLNMIDDRVVDTLTNIPTDLPYEYRWFTLSKIYLLLPEFTFKVESSPRPIPDIIREHIQDMYSVSADEAYYIYEQYSWKSDWEYASETDIENYIYTIKMKLK